MTSTPVNNAQAPDYSYQPSPSPTESISTLPSPSQEMFSPVAFDDPQQPMIPSSQLQPQPPSPSPSPSPHPPSTATVLPPSPPPHQLESNSTNVIPLRKTEVWAWYLQNATYCAYGWVSAVLMVPVLIQDLAARNGVETVDHSRVCDTSVADYKCVMPVFGQHYLDPGTIALYISSFSALVSFVVSLSISPIADYGSYKKTFLWVFAVLGCITSIAFFVIQVPSMIWLTVILASLGWSCYNVSSVFSNAFLPIYARVHPTVLATAEGLAKNDSVDAKPLSKEDVPSDNEDRNKKNMAIMRKAEEQVTNDLAAWCAGAANVGSMVVQLICIGISLSMNNSYLSLQIAIAFTGVWWLMWTLAVMPWLDARPGPPLPKGQNWIAFSWRKNFKTFKSMRKLPQITRFIFAWFILSDGVNTVTALLYVITYQELKFSHTKSLVMTICISAGAFVGAYLFLWIRKLWALSTKFMVMLTLGLYALLTAYFVIPGYFTTSFGLQHEWEAWCAIAYLGLIISTFFGTCKVMMAELCPVGDENEWFSLFQLADKGSSWIGPFVTGAIQSATGDFRIGFWFPLALMAAGGAVLMMVDMDKGKDEAIRFKQEEEAEALFRASIPPITVTSARDSTYSYNNRDNDRNMANL
ncbi:Autophagy protein 22 [Mortierella antarctica]|nr:Autophagy protein 22 [Mortierella antarctica]